ncbi:MAG TPA: hybrid sensor histidine kinase/response regulator [Gallionellaceae bacterium]|nr:hybrid sensor histidine kinase/response regulator [Gallionellaceae bacterium]
MGTTFLQSLAGEVSFHITEENLRIRADQLRARLRLYPVMVLSQILLEPLFVWLFWERADHLQLLSWLTLIYAMHAVEMLLWWRYRTQLDTVQQCRRWSQKFNLLAAAVALMWGGIALWFFPPDLAYQALMICLVLGLVAGAVTLDSVYPPALYIYVIGVSLPILVRLILTDDNKHWILASMLLLFITGSLSAGRELSKTFWKSLYQRHENDFLIMQLIRQMGIAETANRDKSRFLASASHDLRQPLQALVLFSESLQEASKEHDRRHLSLQIRKSVGALVDMFDELLDISKFDAGVVQAIKQHFRVQEVFERLQAEFMPLALAKDLKLVVLPSDQVGYSDPHLLERILRNLISNAIRYTDIGKVQVSCQSMDDMLQFDVMDTGIGIRAASMPHIFEEYYQVDNQHRDRLKGLGLGLAIVRRMEALLGCTVTVVSKPALGSVFSFSIPQGEELHLMQPQVTKQSRHDLSGITVALVEDNREIRLMASRLMQEWGCIVYDGELPNGVLKPMVLAGVRPDILICDYRLPLELTAIDAIRQLRELWDTPIPTLVLTGDTAPQTLQEIRSSGALLLHKPISPARLRSIMYFALQLESSANSRLNTAAQ